MNVLFLIPPPACDTSSNSNSISSATRNLFPSLGMQYVAAHLKARTAHEVQIIDSVMHDLTYMDLRALLDEQEIDVVAFSVASFNLLDAVQAAEFVHSVHDTCIVVFGGHHPTLYPVETANLPHVDYVIVGEGEFAFTALVEALDNFASATLLANIDGLLWSKNGVLFGSGNRTRIGSLDSLPFPSLAVPLYRPAISTPRLCDEVAVSTSRGCPYSCGFCSIRRTGHRIRDASGICDELQSWLEQGVSKFFFIDDNFTASGSEVAKLCSEIRKRRMEISFKANARVDLVDQPMLKALKDAGCVRLYFGVESGVQRHLDFLQKGVCLDQITKAFLMTREAGIETCAYLMIGIPGETSAEIETTESFAVQLRANEYRVAVCRPYPGTPLYQHMRSVGIIPADYWAEFARDPLRRSELGCQFTDVLRSELEDIANNLQRKLTGLAHGEGL